MNKTLTVQRRIFNGAVFGSSVMSNLIIAAWLMHFQGVEEYRGIWRLLLLTVPYTAVANACSLPFAKSESYGTTILLAFMVNIIGGLYLYRVELLFLDHLFASGRYNYAYFTHGDTTDSTGRPHWPFTLDLY